MKSRNLFKSVLILGVLFVFAGTILPGSLTTAVPFVQHIAPSNDPSGFTDWFNLQTAFDAASGDPGAVIELQAGTYIIDEAVVIKDFVGTFKGAGSDQTTIRTPGGNYLFPKITGGPVWDAPAMFVFYYEQLGEAHTPAHITISDMTWHAIGQTEGWVTHVPVLVDQFAYLGVVFGRVTGIEDNEISYVSTTVEHMQFLGEPYSEAILGDWNNLNGFIMEPEFFSDGGFPPEFFTEKWLQGTYTCTNTLMQDIAYGYNVFRARDSTITVGGYPHSANTFINGYTGVDVLNVRNTVVEVSYCETYDCSGVLIELYDEDLAPSDFTIEHNTIRRVPYSWFAAVEVWNYGPENIGSLTIAYNTFYSEHYNPPYAPIFCRGAHNAQILNNIIQGTGKTGIVLFVSSGCYLRGNNLILYHETDQDIYLGPNTSDCTVVLGAADTITDYGTNNHIQG